MDDEFNKKFGIDLTSYIYTIWSVINLAMVPNRVVVGSTQLGEAFLQLLKRGYVMYSLANDALALESRMRLEIGADLDQAALDKLDSKTIAKALDLISLKKTTQSVITSWSSGPRPVIIPYGEAALIDVVGGLKFSREFSLVSVTTARSEGRYSKKLRVTWWPEYSMVRGSGVLVRFAKAMMLKMRSTYF